ncbi:hypothetical protein [Flammeovirga kamogawensis]|uniref:Bacteriocin n=1 Tax=Flammeovirga kamogawensis TaxID=373891 RepID=A0ABX8H4J7_9BACT|nr:hypothetical protein [Flammeovirga kamogawensis]MBB6463543.1 methionyl-tRNA synthetase [Flammeovirga kamogawensis]QWG10598.1 hypothetical protein KM029_24765 [Flammeovirga kamogawensis]TRX63703.1 hypothetical protein EO216_25145 [Flammeovirga kamogawensis]
MRKKIKSFSKISMLIHEKDILSGGYSIVYGGNTDKEIPDIDVNGNCPSTNNCQGGNCTKGCGS